MKEGTDIFGKLKRARKAAKELSILHHNFGCSFSLSENQIQNGRGSLTIVELKKQNNAAL